MSVIVWLESTADLDRALDQSRKLPVVFYKHSLTCGTSAFALDEVRAFLASETAARVAVRGVAVQTARAVSNELARRLGVRHETPQILIVTDGTVAWHRSHFRVSAATIVERVRTILDRSSATAR